MIDMGVAYDRMNARLEPLYGQSKSQGGSAERDVWLVCRGTDIIGPELTSVLNHLHDCCMEMLVDQPQMTPQVIQGYIFKSFWLGYEAAVSDD